MSMTKSRENYLRVILELSKKKEPVYSIDLACAFGYSRASVSRMLKSLAEAGYVEKRGDGEIVLTEAGYTTASSVQKRRELIKRFCMDVLGVEPLVAEKDACHLEHLISQETENKISQYMDG